VSLLFTELHVFAVGLGVGNRHVRTCAALLSGSGSLLFVELHAKTRDDFVVGMGVRSFPPTLVWLLVTFVPLARRRVGTV
jgi:hypothetical protein